MVKFMKDAKGRLPSFHHSQQWGICKCIIVRRFQLFAFNFLAVSTKIHKNTQKASKHKEPRNATRNTTKKHKNATVSHKMPQKSPRSKQKHKIDRKQQKTKNRSQVLIKNTIHGKICDRHATWYTYKPQPSNIRYVIVMQLGIHTNHNPQI